MASAPQIDTPGVRTLFEWTRSCTLCPRQCHVDRLNNEIGFCGIGAVPKVASAGPHFGEEPPLVGTGGSGTIFLSGCNLGCLFCQNSEISHARVGQPTEPAEMARTMLRLQERGCHNINFVTPSHVTAWIGRAILLARRDGLTIPIVYNCGGYESVAALQHLEGLIDIYMPDAKFLDAEAAERYCRAPRYPQIMKESLREMHRQVGDLEKRRGVAMRGLLVRHLVMPGYVEDTRRILEFIAREVSPRTWVNVMEQYRPCYRAGEIPELNRPLGPGEFQEAYQIGLDLGLNLF